MKRFELTPEQKIVIFERLKEMISRFPELGEAAMQPATKALDMGQILSRELEIH